MTLFAHHDSETFSVTGKQYGLLYADRNETNEILLVYSLKVHYGLTRSRLGVAPGNMRCIFKEEGNHNQIFDPGLRSATLV